QTYRSAREAIVDSQGSAELLARYQILKTEHLKTSTTLLDPAISGWKHAELPWFWYLDVVGDSISSDDMKEFHRVNWLRAKAAFDRASEENILVKHEMKWTLNYFQYQARRWEDWKKSAKSYGHIVYAARKEGMWHRFATLAVASFRNVGI
ncbi:hypothetical protein L208DRAFT_1045311, partial [Tricholoma matsutake]